MKTLLLITISILFSSFLVKAQEDSILKIPVNALSWHNPVNNTDSLKALLDDARGQARVDLLCELVFALLRKNPSDKRIPGYLDEAFSLAEKIDYSDGMVKALLLMGYQCRMAENDFQRAIEVLQKAEELFGPQTHWTLKFRIWTAIADNYQNINDDVKAIEYFQKGHLSLDKDTAWYAHLQSHVLLMHHASLTNEHKQKRAQIEIIYDLLQANLRYLAYPGFKLPEYYEELSINLANYGEYRRASAMMLALLKELNDVENRSVYTEFMTAKILGRIARINSHWGRYDSALVYFNRSIYSFDQVYDDYIQDIHQLKNPPSYPLWAINAANQLEERAVVYTRTGNLNKAEKDLLQSMQIRREHNDMLGEAMCCEKMGELFSIRGRFLEALKWYNTALNIKNEMLEQHKRRARIDAKFLLFSNESYASTHLKIARLYNEWSKPPLAREHIRKSLFYSQEAGFQRCEAEALTTLGDIYLLLIQPDSARVYYNTARSIYESMEHKHGLAEIYESIGYFYTSQLAYSEAGRNYSLSQQLYTELEMPASLARVLVKRGDIMASQGYWSQAIDSYREGLEIGISLNLPQLKMNACYGLSEMYMALGEIEEAFRYYKKFHEMKDLLFTLESSRYLAEIETQYETEQNRQKLLLLESQNKLSQEKEARSKMIISMMVVFFVIMLLWVLLYLRQNRLKNGHERILLQQKLFRSQMNPHFIFNSLGSIQSSIINEEPRVAVKYLSRFSKLMRSILDSSIHETIPLSRELSTIENYLALQKARFPQKFDYVISGAEDLDTETLCVPPMLAQPFIENAIEHGIKHKETKGLVSVNYQLTGNILSIVIEDDGIGRKKAGELLRKHDRDHVSMAINITTQRIGLLNRRSRQPIRFQIEDLCDANGQATGTRVVFELPV